MPNKGFKAFTVSDDEYHRVKLYCKKHKLSPAELLENIWEEHEKTAKFASKITKVPESVKVYSPGDIL